MGQQLARNRRREAEADHLAHERATRHAPRLYCRNELSQLLLIHETLPDRRLFWAPSCLAVPVLQIPQNVIPTTQTRPELTRHRRDARTVHDRDDRRISDDHIVHFDKERRPLYWVEFAVGLKKSLVVIVIVPTGNIAALP